MVLIKFNILVLVCFSWQLVASSADEPVCGAGAASKVFESRAARRKPAGLRVDTSFTISAEAKKNLLYSQKRNDRYICHEFRRNFKEAIEDEFRSKVEKIEQAAETEIISASEKEIRVKMALRDTERKIFSGEFQRIYLGWKQDTLVSYSIHAWSRFLQAHIRSITSKPIRGTFNLLHHDPLLVVRK